MHVALIIKSETAELKLSLYNEDLLLLDSETFSDLYTLNFHLQTLAKKHKISKSLMVIHDADKNKVELDVAADENSFFLG